MNLRDFVPPVAVKAIRRARSPVRRFESYAAAMIECGSGYDSEVIAEVVVKKTVRYRDALALPGALAADTSAQRVALALGLAAAEGGKINVLDYGGAAGAHFFAARRLFGESIDLTWHVVETPSMVKAARPLEVDGLKFFDDASAATAMAGGITLAFSSGTLPAMPEPRAFLRWLVQLRAPFLAVVRVGLYDGTDDVINVHASRLSEHGHGPLPPGVSDAIVRSPFTICSRRAVEEILDRENETLVRTDEPGAYLVEDARTFGFYCRRITGPFP
jgi:putative methyltransferase (TIGR04325 family)